MILNGRIRFLPIVMFALSLSGLSFAQGSGPNRSISSFEVKRSLTGRIMEVSVDGGFISVRDNEGKKYQFYMDKETKFKADRKSDLKNKKDLSLADFKSGQRVKITYRADGKRVFEVKLTESEEKKS